MSESVAATYPKPTPEQVIAYNRLVEGIAPCDVRLARMELRADRYPGGVAAADIEELEPSWSETEKGFAVTQRLRVKGTAGREGQASASLNLALELVIEYRSDEPMTDVLFRPFAALNLPVNARPFLREAVANAAVRSGWPPLMIPAFVRPARAAVAEPMPPTTTEPKPRRRARRK